MSDTQKEVPGYREYITEWTRSGVIADAEEAQAIATYKQRQADIAKRRSAALDAATERLLEQMREPS